jgi:hypothetical protein
VIGAGLVVVVPSGFVVVVDPSGLIVVTGSVSIGADQSPGSVVVEPNALTKIRPTAEPDTRICSPLKPVAAMRRSTL